jgi:hypothetical protein
MSDGGKGLLPRLQKEQAMNNNHELFQVTLEPDL